MFHKLLQLVHHHIDENKIDNIQSSPIYKSSSGASKQQPKLLEIETAEEVAATKKYQQKRLDAKKKKEAAKQREMQRILEEKKNIEMELEELRTSQTSRMEANSSTMSDTDMEAIVMKKVNKLKKKYEKKLLSTQEELADLREDFYYQRKQLVEGTLAILYICQFYYNSHVLIIICSCYGTRKGF